MLQGYALDPAAHASPASFLRLAGQLWTASHLRGLAEPCPTVPGRLADEKARPQKEQAENNFPPL